MNKKLIAVTAILWILAAGAIIKLNTEAVDDGFAYPHPIRCTVYCDSGTTASGQQTRYGIVAGRKEWMGCTAALYDIKEDGSIGDFIGYFEFLDTGAGIDTDGDGYGDSIINGTSIDVWVPSEEAAREWQREHGDHVMLQIIPGVG